MIAKTIGKDRKIVKVKSIDDILKGISLSMTRFKDKNPSLKVEMSKLPETAYKIPYGSFSMHRIGAFMRDASRRKNRGSLNELAIMSYR